MKRGKDAAPSYDEIYPAAPVTPAAMASRSADEERSCAHTPPSTVARPESSIISVKNGQHHHCESCEAQQIRLLKHRKHKLCCWLTAGVSVLVIVAVMVVAIIIVANKT